MRSIFYYILPLTIGLSACSGGPNGPTAAERRAAMNQGYRDQLETELRTRHVTDSLLVCIAEQINTATSQGFEYEKTEYDDLGRFRPKRMDPGDNVQRTYLRCAVDDYGRTQLICTYCGSRQFVVQQLQFTSSDGSTILTASIEPNDGSNYSYDIDGTHYQSVTFAYAGRITEGMTQDSTVLANADTDQGALGYIAQHVDDDKLVCNMIAANGKQQKLTLSQSLRQQMAATYELGVLLRESIRLQQENKTAALKISYLQSKVDQQSATNATN